MKDKIIQGDCLEMMQKMDSDFIDTIITDPPYGLSFMGKKWDYDVPGIEIWKECLRVLKPGGTALIFGGSRTYHRMTCAVEDAGFQIKDCIMWLYGSGFPKATDISKQLYKKHKKEEAKIWNGWKSHGLKPAYEPIILAMKSNDGTYAKNAIKHGVSGLNIDETRIGKSGGTRRSCQAKYPKNLLGKEDRKNWARPGHNVLNINLGRYTSNLILNEESKKILDEKSNQKEKVSRFFYCSKASKIEKNNGQDLENNHPTVKPLKLIEYLCKLTKTPTNGIVLDPFAGSGTTGVACKNLNRNYILIEKEEKYIEIIKERLSEA